MLITKYRWKMAAFPASATILRSLILTLGLLTWLTFLTWPGHIYNASGVMAASSKPDAVHDPGRVNSGASGSQELNATSGLNAISGLDATSGKGCGGSRHFSADREIADAKFAGSALAGLAALPLAERAKAFQAYLKSVIGKRSWGLERNLTLRFVENKKPVLEFRIPKGSINPGNRFAPRGGAGFRWRPDSTPESGTGRNAACLSYAVWFPADFDFVKGGKLPGLFGGSGPSGGQPATGDNGFSLRFMWRSDGDGEVYAYIPGAIGRGISLDRGAWQFARGRWTGLAQEVVLNHAGQADGILRVWVNGRKVIDRRDMVYRTTASAAIDGVMAHVFFGGKTPSWAATKDTIVRVTPFHLLWWTDGGKWRGKWRLNGSERGKNFRKADQS